MFTCPTDEIHSLYLDNELPLSHKEQYEAHLESCEKCRAQLEKLRSLHGLFAKDSDALSPDKAFMDASYERLMLKMKYSKTAGHTYKPARRVWKFAVPALAAAAALALIIPIGLNSGRHNVKTMSAASSLYSQLPGQFPEQFAGLASGSENGIGFASAVQEPLVTNVNNNAPSASPLIKDVEVFRPKFDGESKTISIRITVPGDDDVPVTTEIEVPLDVTGQN